MKLVRFNRSMAPHVQGETRGVTDELAERLVAAGDAEIVPSLFDKQPPEEPQKKPRVLPNLTRKTR